MKTIRFIAAAFAALAAVSCVKDEMGGAESRTYQASFADAVKSTISVGAQQSLVSWETSDKVGIMYGTSNLEYKADQAGSHTTLSAVASAADASEVWAVLPYDATATFASGVITTVLPAEQPAKAAGSFHHLAVAHSTDGSLAFANVCGLVRVRVTTEGITKVVVAGKANEKVAGNISITVADCSVSGADAESVALVPAEGASAIVAGDYFLAVLPQTFQNGITVTAYKGAEAVVTKDVAGPVTLSRSGVLAGTIREVTIGDISSTMFTKGEIAKITGTGFSTTLAENTVKVGEFLCVVTAASATELSVVIPEGLAKTVDHKFSVIVKGAEAVESAPFRYYYVPEYTSKSHALGFMPEGLALTTDGYLWITDRNSSPHKLVKVQLSDMTAAATFNANNFPFGCDVNSRNEVYAAAKNKKSIGTIIDGAWSLTQFTNYLNNPMGVAFDSNDNMFVASRDNSKIVQFKGNEYVKSFDAHRATCLVVDQTDSHIFFGSGATGSSANDWKLYRLDVASGEVAAVAGSGTKPASGVYSNGTVGNTLASVIGNISGLFCTVDGYVYFTDSTHALRVLIPGVGGDYTKGLVKQIAGVMGASGNVQIGDATNPLGKLHTPSEIEMDSNGAIYVAENGNSAIRILTPKQ